MKSLRRIADRWKKSVGEDSFLPAGPDDLEKGAELRNRLLKEYRGYSLEEIISGEEIENEYGSCYYIEEEFPVKLDFPEKENLLSNLKLLYGIGQVTEEKLKSRGYSTIPDLKKHPEYSKQAEKFLTLYEKADTKALEKQIRRFLSTTSPAILDLASFHEEQKYLFFDVESLGLFSRPIILFGTAQIQDGKILTGQWLLRDVKEEPAALKKFIEKLEESGPLITYNGKSFDLPYVKERLAFYGLPPADETLHFDALHFTRRFYSRHLPDCCLTTLEKQFFDIRREDDVPSSQVPWFYETYMEKGNPGPLVPIVEHNKQDVLTLARVFSLLRKKARENR